MGTLSAMLQQHRPSPVIQNTWFKEKLVGKLISEIEILSWLNDLKQMFIKDEDNTPCETCDAESPSQQDSPRF